MKKVRRRRSMRTWEETNKEEKEVNNKVDGGVKRRQ